MGVILVGTYQLIMQQLVNGLSVGGIYGLASVGYALIYSVLGFSNFVHGEFSMVGAYAALLTLVMLKFPFPASVVLGVMVSGLVAVGVERLAYRPLRMKNASSLYFFVAAMGMSIFLQNFALILFGANYNPFPEVLPSTTLRLGTLSFGTADMLIFAISMVAVVILQGILHYTRIGRAIRAAAYDRDAASVLGINMNQICFIIFFLTGILAGLSGIFRGIKYTVYPTMGIIVIKAWICAILGGLGSISGALAGGLVLGVAETLIAGFLSTSYRDVFAFILLIAVLLFRPAGLFGKFVEEKA